MRRLQKGGKNMVKIETLIDEEIRKEIELLEKLNPGTDEYEASINGVSKLLDKSIEFKKLETNSNLETNRLYEDIRMREKELEQTKKDQKIKNGLTALTFVGSIGVMIWGALKSWEFEKEGTVTSSFGKSFMSNIGHLLKR